MSLASMAFLKEAYQDFVTNAHDTKKERVLVGEKSIAYVCSILLL
jgi:hypothetical protein